MATLAERLANNPQIHKTVAELLGILGDCEHLTEILDESTKLGTNSKAPVPPTLIERVATNLKQLKDHLIDARAIAEEDSELKLSFASDFKKIENALENFDVAWTSHCTTPDHDELARAINALAEVRRVAARESTPALIRAHLKQMPWGYGLDLENGLSSLLDRPEDRQKMVNYLGSHPNIVGGFVRPEAGLIYRAHPNPLWRWGSILVFVVLALFLPSAYSWLDGIFRSIYDSWPLSAIDADQFFATYIVALFGSAFHLVVVFLKRNDLRASPIQGLLWIHVRFYHFVQGLLGITVVVIAALMAADSGIDWETAFLLGYSSDSLLDVVIRRFDDRVSKALPAITTDLAGTQKPATAGSS